MDTRYSILFAQIRPELQERVSIGLLLIGNGNVFFNFSKNKLAAVKELMNESAYRMLKDSIRNIEKTAIEENKKAGRVGVQQPISEEFTFNTFSQEYLLYLSKYNTNILSFSAPKSIDVIADNDMFISLYRKFIDDGDLQVTPIIKPSGFEYIQTNKEKLVNHFNIDKEVTSDSLPDLIAPVRLDLIGKNEIPVYAKGIDLDRNIYHIEADLSQLLLIDKAFSGSDGKSKGFIISKEPSSGFKQHNIWNQFRKNKSYEYVDVSEFERIINYAKTHDVKPLLLENYSKK